MSFFSKLGHGLAKAGKVTLKVVEVAAPIAAEVVAPAIVPMLVPRASSHSLHGLPNVPEMYHVLPLLNFATGVTMDENSQSQISPLEQFAVTILLGMLQTVIKNPAHKAALKNQLLFVADDIYLTYGRVPNVVPPSALPTA